MKRIASILTAALLLLTLAACGGGSNNGGGQAQKAPDLNQYYEDFMASLGEGNTPAMMDLDTDMMAGFYPGLETYGCKQLVLKMAAISATPFEFALVELEDASHAQEVADIFQTRIDLQAGGGAFYPETVEYWQQAKVITHGSVVALISAGEVQADAEAAFNALFA